MEGGMKVLKILFVAGLLFAASVAMAGKGGPIASGIWSGQGMAVYPDGTIVEITQVDAELTQDGMFIYGFAAFQVEIDGNALEPQVGQMSAQISGNAISGVLGGCEPAFPDCGGVAVFEGKLSGNKMTGTVRDLSDGSTSVITLHRMTDF
jgi:hypothetical protein